MQEDPFVPGDELRAHRGVYGHHGIYLGNDWVMEFGGRILDKPRASVHHVPLGNFAKGSDVSVVAHEQRLDPAESVRRAHWLQDNPPPMRYNLFGYNCEHVARWCATGEIESGQVQRAAATNWFGGSGVILFMTQPKAWIVGVIGLLLAVVIMWISDSQRKRFQRHIDENWLG